MGQQFILQHFFSLLFLTFKNWIWLSYLPLFAPYLMANHFVSILCRFKRSRMLEILMELWFESIDTAFWNSLLWSLWMDAKSKTELLYQQLLILVLKTKNLKLEKKYALTHKLHNRNITVTIYSIQQIRNKNVKLSKCFRQRIYCIHFQISRLLPRLGSCLSLN